jgi:hypothetical protein
MIMRFQIEQRHLTDGAGRPVPVDNADVLSFHLCEAEDASHAVHLFIAGDHAELIGNILTFPGFQAVATVRKTTGVYTLQVTPTSQTSLKPPV